METAREPIWLASASPRRRELLAMLGVSFSVAVSGFDEDSLRHLTDPDTYVRAAATGKAEETATRYDGIILGVDTDVVAPNGVILGKPSNHAAAVEMLVLLSGKTHQVLSGVCVLRVADGKIVRRDVRVVETAVTFSEMGNAAIQAYVATGEPMGKAGAYAIQGGGVAFVARIDGDLSNVIGLPLPTLAALLTDFGVPLWNKGEPEGHGGSH